MTIEEQIQQIENETNSGANTKTRIGSVLRAVAALFKKFSAYTSRNEPVTGDYVVGYNADSNEEIRIPVANLNLAMSYYSRLIKTDVIAGEFNDANTMFVLKDQFKIDSTVIFLNGLRQTLGQDYVEDLNNNSIILAIPPKPNGRIYAEIQPK